MPSVVLVSVTETSDAAAANLAALVSSLAKQDSSIVHVVVVRGAESVVVGEPVPTDESSTTGYRQIRLSAPYRISLSAARNIAIRSAEYRSAVETADLVAFPDDDCAYPPDLLPRVFDALGPDDQFITIPYAPAPTEINRKRFPAVRKRVDPAGVMRYASSNTFFLRPRLALFLGRFDEEFGLGAPLKSSEDSEYLLRALIGGHPGVYEGSTGLCALHPYKAGRPAEYYRGNVAVLATYSRARGIVALLLLRRVLGGAAMVVRRQLKPVEYIRTLWLGVTLLVMRRRPIAAGG